MNKKDLLAQIMETDAAKKAGISKLAAEMVLESFCDVAAAELLGGGEVTLKGIGKLKVREVAARTGHNPQNGQKIEIPATRKVVFVPFGNFKQAIKG